MGTLVGHVAPGFGFLLIGLWHLFNNTRLHLITRPTSHTYTSLPWFPSSILSPHLELYLIILGCSLSIAMELFIGPARHQPLDPADGTIPSNHLHNFEHSSISLTFLVYALSALLLDRLKLHQRPHPTTDLLQFLASLAFAQQLLLFHVHSADHMGVEGHYHWLLQLVIFVSLSTTLLAIAFPKSFIVSFVRSISIAFQGLWLITMGFMLWTPALIPKGCFMNLEEGHMVLRCQDDKSLDRAKSLVNIEFSWFLILLAIFSASFYSIMAMLYGVHGDDDHIQSHRYTKMSSTVSEDDGDDNGDVEAQKKGMSGKSTTTWQDAC